MKVFSFQKYKKTKKIISENKNYNLFENLKKNEKEITITFSPWNFINKNNEKYIPLSGLSKIKTIHCLNQSNYSIIKVTDMGLTIPIKNGTLLILSTC